MRNVFLDDPSLIFEVRQGLERETLRVDQEGTASNKAHPESLGSKLTHPFITTDYSENLLEFITDVSKETSNLLDKLTRLHSYTLKKLDSEMFWPFSMPAILPEDENDIPLAYFGESNVGKLKTLYRKGLGHRYGRSMQSIAGVHYNFSLSDNFWNMIKDSTKSDKSLEQIKSEGYFHIIRNFQRYRWMLMYFFGASPAVHKSFLKGKEHRLEKLGDDAYITPYGTSLRMGGLGYTSNAQASIKICYNKVETYIETLEKARLTPFDKYEKIGLKKDDEYLQLNTHILQIDNEFYTNIRPKNVARSRESALQALHLRGVEYLEVRLLDNDPFSIVGISEDTINFLHLFLIWCYTADSPEITGAECEEFDQKFEKVVTQGRAKDLEFVSGGKSILMRDELTKNMMEIAKVAKAISQVEPSYQESFDIQLEKVANINKLPSSKILSEIEKRGYTDAALSIAEKFTYQFREKAYDFKELDEMSKTSWDSEKQIREEDTRSFEEFLTYYFDKIKI